MTSLSRLSHDLGTMPKKLVTVLSLLASYFQRSVWTLISDRCGFESLLHHFLKFVKEEEYLPHQTVKLKCDNKKSI